MQQRKSKKILIYFFLLLIVGSINNIFLINKIDLKDEIESNTLVENYSIFKRYPSALDINIEKTKFLAK